MSVQHHLDVSDHLAPTAGDLAAVRGNSLREACNLVLVFALLLVLTLALFTSTALIDALLRIIAGVS